jgi:uncharacterized protein DUF4440
MRIRSMAPMAVLAIMLAACNGGQAGSSPVPSFVTAEAAAMPLVTHFFELLKNNDHQGLIDFVSPAFVLQRADGSSADKAEFLDRHAAVAEYTISSLSATLTGDVLVARYMADVVGDVDGRPYTPGPEPRLSVFVWNGSAWQLVAHANFNPLSG